MSTSPLEVLDTLHHTGTKRRPSNGDWESDLQEPRHYGGTQGHARPGVIPLYRSMPDDREPSRRDIMVEYLGNFAAPHCNALCTIIEESESEFEADFLNSDLLMNFVSGNYEEKPSENLTHEYAFPVSLRTASAN